MRVFDPERILQEVRTAACRGDAAKPAKRLISAPEISRLATLTAPADLQAEIAERAGMAADSVPALYLDTWARLQCQKPARVSEDQWRLALDDGGRFLDGWGDCAAVLGWSPGDLFDVPAGDRRGGLIWHLRGERIEALGPDHACMTNERLFDLKV